MEKPNNSSMEEENHSCELPNFELEFYAGPPPREFASLVSEQELNQLLLNTGTRHSEANQKTTN